MTNRVALIIEDDPGTRLALEVALKRAGFTVHSATDRDEGWNLAQEIRPELIFLDYYMGGMSASLFMRLVRRILPNTPVILSTAAGSAPMASVLGTDHFIAKPFDPVDFVQLAQQCVKRVG